MRKWIKQHPISLWGCYMFFYFGVFYLLEKLVKPKYIIKCVWDDFIPFCRWAIIPYMLWFVWVPLMVLVFLHFSRKDFWQLSVALLGGLTFCLLVYIVLPNGLSLRETVYGDDLLSNIVRFIYRKDTPTNVCPSIHVFNSLAVVSTVYHSKLFKQRFRWVRPLNAVLAISICCSTVLLKQHSCVDVFCGMLLCLIMNYVSRYIVENEPVILQMNHKKQLRRKMGH